MNCLTGLMQLKITHLVMLIDLPGTAQCRVDNVGVRTVDKGQINHSRIGRGSSTGDKDPYIQWVQCEYIVGTDNT